MPRLTPRERFLATGVTAVLVVSAAYGTAIRPARDRIGTLERVIPEKLSELKRLRAGITEYDALRQKTEGIRARIAAQNADFQLPTHLETLLDTEGLGDHLVTMTPNEVRLRADYTETIVEIQLQDVQLAQIVEFMAAVETREPLVRVGSLNITGTADTEKGLEATLVIHSPRPAENVAAADPTARP
jgi:type II secretory pathway component PulM